MAEQTGAADLGMARREALKLRLEAWLAKSRQVGGSNMAAFTVDPFVLRDLLTALERIPELEAENRDWRGAVADRDRELAAWRSHRDRFRWQRAEHLEAVAQAVVQDGAFCEDEPPTVTALRVALEGRE